MGKNPDSFPNEKLNNKQVLHISGDGGGSPGHKPPLSRSMPAGTERRRGGGNATSSTYYVPFDFANVFFLSKPARS